MSKQMRCQWLEKEVGSIFSITWEELCRKALPLLSQNWKVFFQPAGRFWQGQGNEWDLISQSLDKKHLLIGEAKWPVKKPSPSSIANQIQALRNKGTPPIERDPKSQVLYTLFVPEKPPSLSLPLDVKLVEAKDVLQAYKKNL